MVTPTSLSRLEQEPLSRVTCVRWLILLAPAKDTPPPDINSTGRINDGMCDEREVIKGMKYFINGG